jgi:hypothetical protein
MFWPLCVISNYPKIMKIEIGENLAYTYLKHFEGCRIVQTNWKTSGRWTLTEFEKEPAIKLLNEIRKLEGFTELFKNVSFEQILKQAEIDLLGINTIESSIFGVEIAFHSSGVNYGEKDSSVSKIVEKLLRTILVMQCYFKDFNKFNAYFITPKSSEYASTQITQRIEKILQFLNDDSISIQFISDDKFYEQIVNPIIADDFNEHDTNELFSRAVKMLKLNYKIVNSKSVGSDIKPTSKAKDDINKRAVGGMKIGQFVQGKMKKLEQKNLLSPQDIANLLSQEYSKKVFNQNFPVLKNSDDDIKDEKGRNRYYTSEMFFGEHYLTSQWFEYHWEPFLSWLKKYETS